MNRIREELDAEMIPPRFASMPSPTNQNAVDWVQEHSYRSPGGKIIYLKSPDGSTEILRDALVKELKALESAG